MMADRHSFRRTLMIFLSAVFLMGILGLPVYAEGTGSEAAVNYVDASGEDMGTKDCKFVEQTMADGWYVSRGATFNSRIQVDGDVDLILENGTTLDAKAGIHVPADSSLTIWAQSTGNDKGKLMAGNLAECNAGIGGDNMAVGGKITINGGEIQAEGSPWAQEILDKSGGPGISGAVVTINGGDITAAGKGSDKDKEAGAGITGDEIVINGGKVDAAGGYRGGAGIGGNYGEKGGKITISGGDVTATSGAHAGAGIGSGFGEPYTNTIKITGGTVKATGKLRSAGIGAGRGDMSGSITISGGTVIATGGDSGDATGGAGIGGANIGDFTGTITISGGDVTAKGGTSSAGIGAGWGGNAKNGHIIITGGSVKAKGGQGAAGIGGGKEKDTGKMIFIPIPSPYTGGEGCDDVQISGGTVFAQSGTGDCSAIGHGDNDGHMGSITFRSGMCVKADDRTDGDMDGDYERGEKPFPWKGKGSEDVRVSACQYRHTALIQQCDHPMTKDENDGFALINTTTHLRSVCEYCRQPFMGEEHSFDKDKKCTVCGYEKEICTVSFDADGGTGTMGVMKAVPGKEIKLPECGFMAPEGKAFAGWNVNGETVDENKPVKIDSDTVVKAVWADAVPLWVGDTQVTVVNAGDILGDGTAKYSGDSSGGTLTLDGAKISASHEYDTDKGRSAGITSQLEGQLQIVVNSSSTVNADTDYGIYSAGRLNIRGQDRLNVRGREGIGCDSSINISGANLVAAGDGSGSGIGSKGNIIIRDSSVTAKAAGPGGSAVTSAEGSITLIGGIKIVSPLGGTIGFKGDGFVILDPFGDVASQAVISKAVSYDVWVGNTQVTSDNADDVLGDGSVSYEPDKHTLFFAKAEPSIENTYKGAMIYADQDLTIVAPPGGLTLSYAGASKGIFVSGDLTMLGNVTVDVEKQAVFAEGDLTTAGDLTARGMGDALTTDGLIEAGGSVFIEGDLSGYNKTGYGLRAGGNADITGDVKLTVVTGSLINAGGSIDIAGNMDNTYFDGQAWVSENGLMADGDITAGGNVKLLVNGTGIRSKEGSINVMTGSWQVNNDSNGQVAMDALKINIPETHGILEPAGAAVKAYTAGDVTRETVVKDDAGDEVSEYAVIGWMSEEHPQDPAAPAVLVTPETVSLPYGTADKDARTLIAVSVVSPESDLGTLRYYWQRQVENDNWQSMASGIDMNEYTIPEDLDAGKYTYRCLVTNSLNGGRAEGTSDDVPVTIEKAASKIVTEPRSISLTYNGRPQRLAMSGSASGGTMLYSLDGERWSTSIPNVTDAGTYTLHYMVQGDENHNDLDGEQIPDGGQIEVTIAKRELVITPEPKQKICGEKDPELTYLAEGLASGDKLVGQLSREAGEDVGTYLISSRGIEPAAYCKDNYTLVPQGDVLTILPGARQITDMINALPAPNKVKVSDKKAIQAARQAYDSLTAEQKALVPAAALKKLTDDEAALAELQKKAVKTVTVNVKTVNAKAVNSAVAKAGGSSKYVTTIVLGKKVKKISKGAFKNYKKAKILVVKSKKLKKSGVKKSLKGSKITKIKVKVGSKKISKKYVKKYKKIFTKKITGKKVKVTR